MTADLDAVTATRIQDVAAVAGVSAGTVSNVLNHPDKVSQRTAARVHEAVRRLGFVRNDAARQLRAGHSHSMGLIVPDIGNPFFLEIARSIESRAALDGVSLLIGDSDSSAERENRYLDAFVEQRVSGVLICPVGDVTQQLHRLRPQGVPFVLVAHQSNDPGIDSVGTDDVAGGRIATEYLIEGGYARIAFVGGPLTNQQVSHRLAGASAASSKNLSIVLEVVETRGQTVADGEAVGRALLSRSADARPDSVFAVNDLVAIGIMRVLHSGNSPQAQQIAIIGYDNTAIPGGTPVPLSSIEQPANTIGQTAYEILAGARSRNTAPASHVLYEPQLIVRPPLAVPLAAQT